MSLSREALIRLRPGRPRRSSRRMAGDRSPRETIEEVCSVARKQRMARGATEKNYRDANHGSTVGKLYIERSISQNHLWTAYAYRTVVFSNARLYDSPAPYAHSVTLLLSPRGMPSALLMTDDEINTIKGKFRDCRRALLDCGRDLLLGSEINRVVYGIVIEDWPREDIGTDTVQNLRCGLNALERVIKTWRPA